jgi:hypothetical protein
MRVESSALEHAIEEITEVDTAIEVDGDTIVVTGIIDTDEERQAVLDVLNRLQPEARIVDNLAMGGAMPEEIGDLRLSETEAAGFAGAQPGLYETEALEPGDFTDQHIIKDQGVASGPSGTHADDDVAEGDDVYIPPTDPPRDSDGEFLGGFQTTADEPEDIPVSEVVPGFADSALEEAVIGELREDAATTALEVEVTSNRGVITLRGFVDDIEDAENAQSVAARIPGVIDVRDELQLRVTQQGGGDERA